MKKSFLATAVFVLTAPFMAATASAQFFAKAEDAVKYRQGAFQMIKAHFVALQPVIKGQVPYDKARVAADVSVLDVISTLPWAAFGPGTEGVVLWKWFGVTPMVLKRLRTNIWPRLSR